MSLAPVMMSDTQNVPFKVFVEKLMAGRSARDLSRLTREAGLYVNATTIGDMKFGIVPGYRLLERFAAALELEPAQKAELFRRAGYVVDEGESGAEYFVRELARLREKHGRAIPVDLSSGMESLTVDHARQLIAALEKQLDAGII